MASKRKEQLRDLHLRIMIEVSKNPSISTRMLSKSLGISNGSSYYCIRALIKKGLVKLENFKSAKNKRHYSYFLTKAGIIEKTMLTSDFLKRKKDEYDQIKSEIDDVLESIEVQSSSYLSEDVVEQFEDRYGHIKRQDS